LFVGRLALGYFNDKILIIVVHLTLFSIFFTSEFILAVRQYTK